MKKLILATDFDPTKLGCRVVDLDNNKIQSYYFVKVVNILTSVSPQLYIDTCLPNFEYFEDKEKYFNAVDDAVGYNIIMCVDTIDEMVRQGDADCVVYFDPSALQWDIRENVRGFKEQSNG